MNRSPYCLLTRRHLANSGAVVLLRALVTALLIFLLSLGIRDAVDPARLHPSFSLERACELVAQHMHWFGAIFAATYAGLYARFASQWTYLADLYNKIKETEVTAASGGSGGKRAAWRTGASESTRRAIAQWKAGFIEDAEDLHLATKHMFTNLILAWGKDELVARMFDTYTVGGKPRLEQLLTRVAKAVEMSERERREKLEREHRRSGARKPPH